MAAPLLLLGLTTISAGVTGISLNKAGTEDPTLTPKIFGLDATMVTAGGGVLLALLGGPLMAAIGAGLLAGSVVSWDGLKRDRDGLEEQIMAKVAEAMAQQAPQLTQVPEVATRRDRPRRRKAGGRAVDTILDILAPANA